MTIILGVDPGSRITGYGLIKLDGTKYHFLDCGIIKTDVNDIAQRCRQIFIGLQDVISEFNPDESGVEQVFMNTNANSALKLGQARGAALAAIATNNILVAEYTPRRIKQAVVGYGAADKQQIQHMIKLLLNLQEMPATDAADALAVALCHANSRGIKKYDSHASW